MAIHNARLTLNTHNQSIEQLHGLINEITSRGGCMRCGRVAYLEVAFLSDPPPDLAKDGVISYAETGGA